jgi:phosphoglycerate kinase
MEDIFKIKIKFFPVLEFERCRKDIDSSPFPSVFLFENLRFLPQEENNDPDFSCNLASLGDVYCNDAFSVSHRAHASTQGITNYLPSFAGFLVQRELSALSLALDRPLKPVSAIVGGSKISTKLAILNHLADKVDFLIVGGAMANTFLKAQGYDVGKSLIEEKMIKIAKKILTDLELKNCKLVLPVDAVCASSLHEGDGAKTFNVDLCPSNKMILDIGPASQENIIKVINKSKTLIWNGPLGAFEFSPFDRATNELARYVAKSTSDNKITSVAGGGDTVSALKASCSAAKFSYVSTAGGAFLEWLEGKKLPGIESLK